MQGIGKEGFASDENTTNTWNIFPNWDVKEGGKTAESFNVENTSFYAIWEALEYIYSNFLENQEETSETSSWLF